MKKVLCLFLLAFMMVMPHVFAVVHFPDRRSFIDMMDVDVHDFYQHILEVNSQLDDSERFVCSELVRGEETYDFTFTLSWNGADTEVYVCAYYDRLLDNNHVNAIRFTSDNMDKPATIKALTKSIKLLFVALGMEESEYTRLMERKGWHNYKERGLQGSHYGRYHSYRMYDVTMYGRYIEFYSPRIKKSLEMMITPPEDNRQIWMLYRAIQ